MPVKARHERKFILLRVIMMQWACSPLINRNHESLRRVMKESLGKGVALCMDTSMGLFGALCVVGRSSWQRR